MNPKPVRKLINLNGHAPGLAGRYQWEKEVLIDYIASRFLIIWEDVEEDAEAAGICSKSDYLEMLQISAALRRHPNAGMTAKIDLGHTFGDLRDFVEWSKEELADYLIHQIVQCELVSVFESRQGQYKAAEEISELASAIYYEENEDGFRQACLKAKASKDFRDARRSSSATEPAKAGKSPRPRVAA